MKTIQLIETTPPATEDGEPTITVIREETVADDRWPNAVRRYRGQAQLMNRDGDTDVYGMREKPEE